MTGRWENADPRCGKSASRSVGRRDRLHQVRSPTVYGDRATAERVRGQQAVAAQLVRDLRHAGVTLSVRQGEGAAGDNPVGSYLDCTLPVDPLAAMPGPPAAGCVSTFRLVVVRELLAAMATLVYDAAAVGVGERRHGFTDLVLRYVLLALDVVVLARKAPLGTDRL